MKTHDSKNQPLVSSVPDEFFSAYVEAALWSSTYETEDRDDKPLDDGEHDLSQEAKDAMLHDCAAWFHSCEENDLPACPDYGDPGYPDAEKSGHDLWLTRNRHGAGYWDRGLGEIGEKLRKAAHAMGERDLYLGDDGLIYQG